MINILLLIIVFLYKVYVFLSFVVLDYCRVYVLSFLKDLDFVFICDYSYLDICDWCVCFVFVVNEIEDVLKEVECMNDI